MPALEDARTLQPVTAATLGTLDLIYVFGAGVNDPLTLSVPEFRKTLFNVVGEAPVNAAAASCTLDPTGANNTVTLTVDTTGPSSLTAAITVPTAATLTVSQVGNAITIAAGAKHRMTVAGTLSPDATGVLLYAGQNSSYPTHPEFSTDGTQDVPETGDFVRLQPAVSGESILWTLVFYTDGEIVGQWNTSDSGSFPDGLTFVADDAETGTPTVTASAPTAAQVVAAFNAAISGITASGEGTGAVAAVTATDFTGGVDATVSSSFVIATTTTLYVNVGTYAVPVWKEASLSDLS